MTATCDACGKYTAYCACAHEATKFVRTSPIRYETVEIKPNGPAEAKAEYTLTFDEMYDERMKAAIKAELERDSWFVKSAPLPDPQRFVVYNHGATCDVAGLLGGQIYALRIDALNDARLLSQYNPVGFNVEVYYQPLTVSTPTPKITPPNKPATSPRIPPQPGQQWLPSAHGGKPIPVVRSHSAIAAAKAQAAMPIGQAYDYKTHMLVGRKSEDDKSVMIARWPFLPTKEDIDKAIANSKGDYLQFALVAPVNFWDR